MGRMLAVGALLWGFSTPLCAQTAPPTSPTPPMTDPTPPQSGNGGNVPQLGGDLIAPDAPMSDMPDIGVAWPDLGADPNAPTSSASTAANYTAPRYQYHVSGLGSVNSDAIMTSFDGLSELEAGDGKADNFAQIDRRIKSDQALMVKVMRSQGYYDAYVDPNIETLSDGNVSINLVVTPGPQYDFDTVAMPGIETTAPVEQQVRDAFGVKAGDPVIAENVQTGTTNVKTVLGQTGFPFAEVSDPKVTVDHLTADADLSMAIDGGGRRTIGDVKLNTDVLFNTKHITHDMARFKKGDIYDVRDIDDLRNALIATGLVASVQVQPVPGQTPDTADIEVNLRPGKLRNIAAEFGLGTGQGARADISWTNKNMVKPEGALTLRGVLGTEEQLFGAILRFNNWHRRDQVLTMQAVGSNITSSAYDAKTFQLSGIIERQTNPIYQKKWAYSYGVEIIATDERDTYGPNADPRRRTFLIGALPLALTYDATNNWLDPQYGYRIGGRLSPELSFQNSVFGYVRVQLDASGYYPAMTNLVLAGRVRLGSILGADTDRLAPSRRFYARGGGSVRGYGYQDIGPRDLNNDPVGGSSITEISLEARYRFGNFGIVPFLDGGNIGSGTLPGIKDLQFGAGLGFRYYSSFGPIRVDLATPLDRQPGDPRIAVYISLGQAF